MGVHLGFPIWVSYVEKLGKPIWDKKWVDPYGFHMGRNWASPFGQNMGWPIWVSLGKKLGKPMWAT